ncbi:hypothetical protein [Streptomyces luteogriseus]|uniref:hypothetical protein n=1 Tax=Streptomyces luteogriseus TaxID=68233 RepID=UPI0037F94657
MLAVLIPLLMLGVVLVLGRYEELLLPQDHTDRREPDAVPPAAVAAAPSPAPAGTPAPSP